MRAITATALDWLLPPSRQLPDSILLDIPDIVLVVDCIYHPSLIKPLLRTIEELSVRGRTVVWVVCELRAEDVVREFLEGWLEMEGGWKIWSMSGEGSEGEGQGLGPRYGMWIGWKPES